MNQEDEKNNKHPIDIETLRTTIQNRIEIEIKLLHFLYEAGTNDIITLEANINEETPGEWESAAHGLSGAAGNLCANDLAMACEEAEDNVPEEIEHRVELLEKIKYEFQNVMDYILILHPNFMEDIKEEN